MLYGHGRTFRVRNANHLKLFQQEKRRDARRRHQRQELLRRWWAGISTLFSREKP